jgi:hypothetical protein
MLRWVLYVEVAVRRFPASCGAVSNPAYSMPFLVSPQTGPGLGGLPLGLDIFSEAPQLQQFQDVTLVPPTAAAAAAAAAVAAAMAAAAQSTVQTVHTGAQDKPQQPANNSIPVKAGSKLHSKSAKASGASATQPQTAPTQQQVSTSPSQSQASTEGEWHVLTAVPYRPCIWRHVQ